MIKINVIKENINIKQVTVNGHANYNEYGLDIVCSSVSSIVQATIEYIVNIDKESIKFKIEDGLIIIDTLNKNEIVQKLLSTMTNILINLQSQYNKNIKVKIREV
ncbi:MAG: ribosomal-processing cysteine protease Prp [Bacilli bacterium]